MRIGAQLYVKGSVEAAAFYQKAFGLTLGFHVQGMDETFAHAELMLGGQEFLALSERRDGAETDGIYMSPVKHHPNMQFSVSGLGEDGVRRAYSVLSEGALFANPLGPCPWNELCAGLMDKFGVFWWIAS